VIASRKDGTTFPVELFVTARQSGEHWQFIGVLPNTNGTDALKLAERLRQAIESMQVDYEGQSINRTVSIGIACLQDRELDDEDSLLTQADQALYKAKECGRNRVILYEP
jgi:diguanylate cyclase (GGDEF)-like protein